jgi:DNA-binding response OmpR family regulator
VISDLQMPNMDGFEFLSVVRQRFPHLPVIVISGAFSGVDVPNSVLADAFFEKAQYTPDQLIARIADLVRKIPIRPLLGELRTPVWIPYAESEQVAVTCSSCLRTFSIPTPLASGTHKVACQFCSSTVSFRFSGE